MMGRGARTLDKPGRGGLGEATAGKLRQRRMGARHGVIGEQSAGRALTERAA